LLLKLFELCTVLSRVDCESSLKMSAALQSIFRFSKGSGAHWIMMSIFDTNGHCQRFELRADSEDPWEYTLEPIDDAYFRQDWYFLQGTWVTRVNSLRVRNFREALTAIADDYLEWFEDIFLEHSKTTRKRISYLGAVGGANNGRDLGNKVYSVVIAAAFEIRAQRGLRVLQCSDITSTAGRGDIVETLLGCAWQYEHINGTITKALMYARTALEAACLGVELLQGNMPGTLDQHTLVQAALAVPDFPVNVPAPAARGYQLQDQAWRTDQSLREQRNIFQVALGRKFGDLVRHRIYSYL